MEDYVVFKETRSYLKQRSVLWVCFVIGPIDDVLINVDCSNRFDRNDLCTGDHFWRLVSKEN